MGSKTFWRSFLGRALALCRAYKNRTQARQLHLGARDFAEEYIGKGKEDKSERGFIYIRRGCVVFQNDGGIYIIMQIVDDDPHLYNLAAIIATILKLHSSLLFCLYDEYN